MRLVYSWLRELVEVPATADEIATRLSLRGFEIAAIEPLDGGDAVIDVEITANRPDCLSVLGLAREVGTIYDLPVQQPSTEPGAVILLAQIPTLELPARDSPTQPGDTAVELAEQSRSRDLSLTVAIDDTTLCRRFAAAIADVSVGPSPPWMAARLHAAGVRPISNLVDITNYVNLEIGQPMHAYDLDKLGGSGLRARRAHPGELIVTLDGIERTLDGEILVIADESGRQGEGRAPNGGAAQGIAGVMGAAASQVSSSTTHVAFEAAYFKPASVRRASKQMGLKTEASIRFERGANIGAQSVAIRRAAALLDRLGAGRITSRVIDLFPNPPVRKSIRLRRERLALLLGAAVPDQDAERIMSRLGLEVTRTADGWQVVAPTFRVDLSREEDLIEEVGRHYGFERLPATFPAITHPVPPPDPRIIRDRLIRRVLTGAGLSEVVTFGFIEANAARAFSGPDQPAAVAIANPLSAKFDTLRPSILSGIVSAVAHNRRHGRRDVRLFELGTRFTAKGESRGMAIAWTGDGVAKHWSGPSREVDFFDVKGVVESLCAALGVTAAWQPARAPFLEPGQTSSIECGGLAAGILGRLRATVGDPYDLPRQDPVFVAELDLDVLEHARVARGATSGSTTSLPRFPFVVRDLSILVSDILPSEIIRGTIQAASRELPAPLVEVTFFDRYQGQGVPDQMVSLSVRLTFQALDRTLTDQEVQLSFDRILAALVQEHAAVQR
ncbi:MAG TPA: phenylalanine--tRNA ligase subunit beta [Vicinamibacterales bacterium]|nr:phenylalanine--tRNA ligase subunit beta [Vicinamibacterales bacterium]